MEKSLMTDSGLRLPLAVPVYVQNCGERMLAYRDRSGIWRRFESREVLRGQVHRIPYEASN